MAIPTEAWQKDITKDRNEAGVLLDRRSAAFSRRRLFKGVAGGLGGLLVWGYRRVHAEGRARRGTMKLSFRPYTLELRHTFTLSKSSRKTTPALLSEVEFDGLVGYGEAAMPPYLGESQQTASDFLARVDLGKYSDPFQLEAILADVDAIAPGNTAAKAALDIALHDLVGKLLGQPWYRVWGYDRQRVPPTSYTVGIDTSDVVRQKVREAADYRVIKVKLGRDNDRAMIEAVRSVTDKPIVADPNQGWNDRQHALDLIHWLSEKSVTMVEQPLPKDRTEDLAWLTERSPIPIMADEGVQRLADVGAARGVYSGINVKLMKCTGLREAHKMLLLARSLGMKTMIGCMTETSCAISAASHLASLADWVDLDGALLISNDPFEGMQIVDGKPIAPDRPGIGVKKRSAE